ncbi:MAG: bifunctional metallophosphatase/5'-nucleotidase [Elusimicrobia bacterium]|nr:bifunctional metallophosphatase/5'-nucleotidase [Elusimicrobiota bacterium]
MRLIKFPALIIVIGLLLSLSACSKTDKVIIYATARSGGWLWARPDPDAEKGEIGGYAVFKNVYNLEQKPKLAVDLGNWFNETPEGYLTKGQAAIDCMNAIPYAVSSLGIADLALAPKDLQKLVKTAAFPVIASNLYLKTGKKPEFIKSLQLLLLGKTKIGFLSVTVMDPDRPNTPKYLANYKFEKESYELQRSLKALKDAGADITALLLNINPKKPAGKGFYTAFFARLPRLDLIITDDPALKKPSRINKAWLVPVPSKMASAARIELSIDPAGGRLLKAGYKLLPLEKEKYGQDPETLKIVSRHREKILKHFSKRLGTAADDLNRSDKSPDSPLGGFTADCVRRWARTNGAIINNAILAGDIAKGAVTVGDLYRVLPYDTSVVFVKIRGEDLRRAIEETVSKDISVSGLQVRMKGQSVDSLLIEGTPLAANRIYRVAVPDSIVNDKDYTLLSSATEFANSHRFLREVIGWCFSRRRTALKPAGGRIIREQQ